MDYQVDVGNGRVLEAVGGDHEGEALAPVTRDGVDRRHVEIDLKNETVKSTYMGAGECDQIGRFLKVLDNKILTKVAQIISNFLGCFEKPHSYVKTAVGTSWVTFGDIWATFYSNIWSHWCRSMKAKQQMIC